MGFSTGGGSNSLSSSSDVALSSPTTNNVLRYDSSVSKWKNANLNDTFVIKGTASVLAVDFGILADGTTDNKTNIDALFAALPRIQTYSTAGSTATVEVIFPAGMIMTSGDHHIVDGTRTIIRGMGRYGTVLRKSAANANDMFIIEASNVSLRDLNIDGNRSISTGGDGLVINATYTTIDNCSFYNNIGNNISIGRDARALEARLRGIIGRDCKGHNVQVYGTFSATDGQFSDCDFGRSGLSGIQIDSSSQNLVNIHVWESGIESTSDRDGFHITSNNNLLTGCQSETNMGRGFHVEGDISGFSIIGGSSWGNYMGGIVIDGASNGIISGVRVYSNGLSNTSQDVSPFASGINFVSSGGNNVITGNNCYDRGNQISASGYSYSPTNPFPGRANIKTQTYGYAESDVAYNLITGNNFRGANSLAGANNGMTTLGTGSVEANNLK